MIKYIFSSRVYTVAFIIILLLYFAFWWCYKLDTLPGLHGDEAWVGLKAYDYQTQPFDRLSGMTYYTGIIQTLVVQLSFNIFGIGVYQLRLPGVIINLLAIMIILSSFIFYRFYKQAVLFTLMLAASTLYVISARIAWEVNTFNLFFISISFASLMVIYHSRENYKLLWICLFWLSNILGSYNHIIYSCISVAGFIGLSLWAIQKDAILSCKLFVLTASNFVNVVLVFLIQRYNLNFFYQNPEYLPMCIAVIIGMESAIYYKFFSTSITIGFLPRKFNYLIISILCLIFVYNHGKGLFDVLSQYKLILEVYSYECSTLFQTVFTFCATLFVLFAAWLLFDDIKTKANENTIVAYIIISYMALLGLYTSKNSLRYYLVIYAALCLYMAFKLFKNSRSLRIFISFQLLIIILINAALLDIFVHDPIPVRSVDFKIGNDQDETSSAFLPKKPVLDFLKNNHISKINYLCYPYFIEEPIKFYKLYSPWTESKQDSALIDYDYTRYKGGFFLLKSK